VVVAEIFGSVASRVTLPFSLTTNLLQRLRRVRWAQCGRCGSIPRPWLCDLHMTVASSGLQFIHPNLKDTLSSGMGEPLERC
jgi:hypothetical protein